MHPEWNLDPDFCVCGNKFTILVQGTELSKKSDSCGVEFSFSHTLIRLFGCQVTQFERLRKIFEGENLFLIPRSL